MATEDSDLWKEAQRIKEDLLKREREFIAAMIALWERIQTRLRALYERLFKIMEAARDNAKAPMSKRALIELEETQRAIAETMIMADQVAAQWVAMIEARQREAIQRAEDDGNTLLEISAIMAAIVAAMPAAWLVSLGPEAVQEILSKVLDPGRIREILSGHIGAATAKAIEELATGVLAGKAAPGVLADVLKEINKIADNAALIGKSEPAMAHRKALEEIYGRTLSPIIGYRRVSMRDAGVCISCLFLDGKFYKIGESMYEHPAGRCILVPIFEGTEKFSAPWQTGRQWFDTLSADEKKKIMGEGRYKIFLRSKGKMKLDDLLSVTKDENGEEIVKIKPLKELA